MAEVGSIPTKSFCINFEIFMVFSHSSADIRPMYHLKKRISELGMMRMLGS